MEEKDKSSKSKQKNLQDNGLFFFFWSLFSEQTKDTHGYQFTQKCAHTHKHTTLFDDMFPHALLCWITPDFWLAFPFYSFFISPLCARLCEYFASEPLSKFWQGPFSIWTDSRRGKCKALHPLLNNITTWEASTRHLHFMASVSPFGTHSTPKHVDSEGSNWRVLARCVVMQTKLCKMLRVASFL